MRSRLPFRIRSVWPSVMAVAGCLISLGCGSTLRPAVKRPAEDPLPSAAVVMAKPLRPQHGTVPRGTHVPPKDLGERLYVNGSRGFALAFMRGDTYPAVTRNGGRAWKVAGPVFFTTAADAPAAVTLIGAVQPETYLAFGGGSVVDLSTDAGKHWWTADLGDDVLSVAPGSKPYHLIAVVQDFLGSGSSKVHTVVYVSTDGGHDWRATTGFAY